MTTSYWFDCQGQCIDGKYYLQQFLGHGNFGGVFLAHHVAADSLLREVAIKLIFPRPDMLERQIAELRGATTLHHPNLLSCYDAGECVINGTRYLYLVMERADETLGQRLDRGLLALGEMRETTQAIAGALRYLHDPARCHVHRDVKPDNLLRVGNAWKLSDMGLLREVNDGTADHTGMIAGTFAYMPPESFEGEVSPAWDIWSLGVLLVVALTGRPPFEGRNPNDLIRRIQNDTPRYGRLPEPFDAIVQGCLQKSRSRRWTAQQVLGAVDGIGPGPGHGALAPRGLAALSLASILLLAAWYLPAAMRAGLSLMVLLGSWMLWRRFGRTPTVVRRASSVMMGLSGLLLASTLWPSLTERAESHPPKMPQLTNSLRADRLYTHARQLRDQGSRQGAIQEAQSALLLNPDHLNAHLFLAEEYMESLDMARAVTHLKRAVDLSPEDMQVRLSCAVALDYTDQRQEAITMYQSVFRSRRATPEQRQMAREALKGMGMTL